MTSVASFPKPFDLYRKIVQVDEFSDNDAEATAPDAQLQLGTSVRAGAKYLQSAGHIKQYLWAESVEDIRAWQLAGFGGIVLGINWTEQMFEPDHQGVIRYTGSVVGGHCIKTRGWKDNFEYQGSTVRACRIQNSWGTSWGDHGFAWIIEKDLVQLLADQGEACAAVEQAVKR